MTSLTALASAKNVPYVGPAIATVNIGISSVQIIKNDSLTSSEKFIDAGRLVSQTAVQTGAGASGTYAGALIGTAVMPGVGTFVGGIAGAFIGGFGGSLLARIIPGMERKPLRIKYVILRPNKTPIIQIDKILDKSKFCAVVASLESKNLYWFLNSY